MTTKLTHKSEHTMAKTSKIIYGLDRIAILYLDYFPLFEKFLQQKLFLDSIFRYNIIVKRHYRISSSSSPYSVSKL